jgi:hypothetical protein
MTYEQETLLADAGGDGGRVSGGVLGSRVFTSQPVSAQEESKPAKVIQAQEFRLVDDEGKTCARLTLRPGKPLAEVPDLTKWTISFVEKAKGKQ